MNGLDEENPALGWRAMRIGLDRPGAAAHAVARDAARRRGARSARHAADGLDGRRIRRRARDASTASSRFAQRVGREPPRSVELGVMVEVPSLLWQLDEIARRADFLSVGSNDLMQYLFAADRDNKRVADRFDPLSAGFLRALKVDRRRRRAHGTPVALCGEIGGRPLEAMALIAIGFRNLSMSAASIGPVKAMALSMNVSGGQRRARRDARRRRRGPAEPARTAARARRKAWACACSGRKMSFRLRPFPLLPFSSRNNVRRRQSRSHPAPL